MNQAMTAVSSFVHPRRLLIAGLGLLAAAALLPASAQAGPKLLSGKDFSGENPLGAARAEFAMTQDALDLLYQRRYDESLMQFERIGVAFPDTPTEPVGRALVYQALMFENFDYAQERQYQQEYATAAQRFKKVSRRGADKAWLDFLEAVHVGVDAIWLVRKSDYLSGLNKAWEALELLKTVKKQSPDFVDLELAFGLYNYWRTAYTEEVDFLPKFGEHREEGLAQMKLARDKGLLAPAPAALALAYSHMESSSWDKALADTDWVRERYPTSILNEMTRGRILRSAKRWSEAIETFERVLAIAPDNGRVWFHIGETHYKSRQDNDAARKAYQKYIQSSPIAEYRAHAYYRLGLLERRTRNYDGAIKQLEKAVETWPKFKAAGTKLAQIKAERDKQSEDRRRGGKVSTDRAVKVKARAAKAEGS